MKRILVVFLGIFFAIPTLYADNPFEDEKITAKKTVSNNELETADISIVSNAETKENEQLANITFPVKGELGWDGIRMREWPWGPIMDKYNKTELTVLGISGEFYEVDINGTKGYMHKNFISIPNYPASGEQPYYPGETWDGGYLSREEGIKVSNASVASKEESDSVTSSDTNSEEIISNETKKKKNGGITPEDFKSVMKTMKTPTREEIIKLAASKGIKEDYIKIVIGTTQREGYVKDTYLHYGWASAMLNQKVTIKQMQGWDPKRKGDSNYYSQVNINKGYKAASATVLKAVYLSLKYRNKKIIECNGMYKKTPKSYNRLYKSSVYNCSVYEKK